MIALLAARGHGFDDRNLCWADMGSGCCNAPISSLIGLCDSHFEAILGWKRS